MCAGVRDKHKRRTGANQFFSPLIELKFVLSVWLDDNGLRDGDAFKFAWQLENNSQAAASAMCVRIVHTDLGRGSRIDNPMKRFRVRADDRRFESAITKLPERRELHRIRLGLSEPA